MKLLQILPTDEMQELTIDVKQMKEIPKILKQYTETHKTQPKKLYSWESEDFKILCFGWYKGKAGQENKHELLPGGIPFVDILDTSETQLLFGPLFLVKQTTKLADLTTEEYGEFYSLMIGGVDDLGEETEETEESEDSEGSLHEFIDDGEVSEELSDELEEECDEMGDSVSSDEMDESEMILDSDEELEEDTYDY